MNGVENDGWIMTFHLLQIIFISNVYYKVTLYFCFPPTSIATIHNFRWSCNFLLPFLIFLLRCTPRHSSGSCILQKEKLVDKSTFFFLHNICRCHPRLIRNNHHESFWCIGVRSYGNVYFFVVSLFRAQKRNIVILKFMYRI